MIRLAQRLVSAFAAVTLMTGLAAAQSKVTISVGGAGCLCYLPTMLAESLGEYEKAGIKVELIDFKGERMDWGRSVTVDLNEGETADLRVEFEQVGKNRILSLFWDYENEAYLAEAKALAGKSDAVVLVGGMSGFMEREGTDLNSICLSPAQERLINEIHAIKPDAPVVIVAGGAIDMQAWIKKAPAILMAWYPGQQGGYALANILLGKVNPSGKLPVTFPVSVDQYPAGHYVQANQIEYKEGIFMGYRFFDHEEKVPQFPFGFGLSYTGFKYENLSLESTPAGVTVRAKITNTGKVAGDEVAQVYVSQPVCSVPRPVRELKGFQRVTLQPGESKTVEIHLDPRAFAFYDVKSHGWKVEEGEFVVSLGSSSRDIRLTEKVTRPSAALGM